MEAQRTLGADRYPIIGGEVERAVRRLDQLIAREIHAVQQQLLILAVEKAEACGEAQALGRAQRGFDLEPLDLGSARIDALLRADADDIDELLVAELVEEGRGVEGQHAVEKLRLDAEFPGVELFGIWDVEVDRKSVL